MSSSFVEIVLTPQEVVLGVRMGCLQFLASVILQSSSWHLAKISLRIAWRYRIIWHVILACPNFLKLVSIRDMAPADSAYSVRREMT